MDKITVTARDLVMFLMGDNIDRDMKWDLTEHQSKRTRSQNNFYWQILGQVAKASRVSSNRIHNIHLRQLGICERIGDKLVTVFLPDTDEAENDVLESMTYHLKPTDATRVGSDGVTYRGYLMLRGSSSFNVSEMSALVDLLLQDAESLGIQTITPSELAHMRELEKAFEERNKKHSDG